VIIDTDSFKSKKHIKVTMDLPKMIFRDLSPDDHYGLKVLKDGFNSDKARDGVNWKKIGDDDV